MYYSLLCEKNRKSTYCDNLKVECGNIVLFGVKINMAAMCGCCSRLIVKNLKTLSLSRLTKNSLKSKSVWTKCNGSVALRSIASSLELSPKSITNYNSVIHSLCGKQISCELHTSQYLRNEIREIKVPQLAESLSEGDIRWDKGVGDQVAEDEVICEVETDKTSVPVHAPCAGVIEELLVEDGATVTPGMSICKLKVGAGKAASPSKKEAAKPAEEPSAPSPEKSQPSPDVALPPPTAPPPVPPKPSAPASSTPVSSIKIPVTPQPLPPGQAESVITGSRTEQRVKINRMRQRIAQRLKEAQNTYAMLTTFNEIDMSNIMEMRAQYKDAFLKKHNIKLGFMSAFVKAAAYALQDQPVVNAVIDEGEIVYRDYIDISVAVATPKGLVVPVIRNLEKMNYADIEKAINAMGEKARTGSIAIEDMDGGTFTISNGGVFGSLYGTPIINPPQSAILGMHGIFDRPVAIKGKVEIKPMMYVALTYDHRLVDGREAVLFLRKIKAAVEDPRIMLLDL